ncbi:glutamate racemase [Candidatus Nomurabacteria bacterium]|nr:glutamate racemase [Candidatus Nomurabacteria bacterium]
MIGIFDSGFGGLSVLREIERELSGLSYVYLGDNARAPYGDKDQATIYQYTKEAIDYLFSNYPNLKLIILACNTASAEALRKLQQEYLPKAYPKHNLLGVIRPVAEEAVLISENKKIAVIGTQATVSSGTYVEELKLQNPNSVIYQQACPLLVPLVEESQEESEAAKLILEQYLEMIKKEDFDTIILGCTHYSFLKKKIDSFFKGKKKIVDGAIIVASKLAKYLTRHPEYLEQDNLAQQKIFLTTGNQKKFEQAAEKFLGRKINCQNINLSSRL